MKILLINVTYDIGSTGKIVKCLHEDFLKRGHDSKVIVGRRSSTFNNRVLKFTSELESKVCHMISKINGNLYGGMHFSTGRIIKFIKKEKPDIVHLHCVNGFFVNVYKLLTFLKKNNIGTVLTNHSDFMFTGNCGCALGCQKWKVGGCERCGFVHSFNSKISLDLTHRYFQKMKKAFENFGNLSITNVSEWLALRSASSIIQKSIKKNSTILNPIDDSLFSNFVNNPFETKHKNVFYCTADFNNPEKGGERIFVIASAMPNVDFWIKSSTEPNTKRKMSNVHFINENISLKDYYHYADSTIILSKAETFSMVVAESLFCGTPVVGFKCGGPESIAIDDFSFFVEQDDVESFVESLKKAFLLKSKSAEIIYRAKEKYDRSVIAGHYLETYKKLLER